MPGYFPQRDYPIPASEAARLQAVGQLEFLLHPDFERDHRAALTHLCELARELLGVDRAFVSLVFENDQRFAAKANVAEAGTPRSMAFCAHTVAQNKPLVVRDATADARFAQNPLVTGDFQLRFYAGVPLQHGGQPVGTFCIVSSEPRELRDDELGRLGKISHVANDYVRLLVREHELAQQSVILRQSERLSQMGGWTMDVDREEILWSEQLYGLHEIDCGTPITAASLAALYPAGGDRRFLTAVRKAAASGKGFEMELDYVTASGSLRAARIGAQTEGRTGRSARVIGTFRDVTDQRELEARWEEATLRDPASGLPNEAMLRRRLDELCAEGARGTLVVAELTGFAALRDALGREAADATLRRLAVELLTSLPPDALLGRLGSDELAAVFVERDARDWGIPEAQTFQSLLEAHFREVASTLPVIPSTGVAVFPDDASNGEALLHAAGLALREAGLRGGPATGYFSPVLRERLTARVAAVDDVRRALGEGKLSLLFQPFWGAEGYAQGFEALLSWGTNPPAGRDDEALAAAREEASLGAALTAFALERAIQQAGVWTAASVDFRHVSVRVGAPYLSRRGWSADLLALLRRDRVAPSSLILELPEEVCSDATREPLRAELTLLGNEGVRFALGAAGRSFASLTALQDLGIATIKLDPSLVRALPTGPRELAIAQAVVAVAKALHVSVIAAGVDNGSQREIVATIGCDLVQGDYLGCPMLPGEAQAVCAAR